MNLSSISREISEVKFGPGQRSSRCPGAKGCLVAEVGIVDVPVGKNDFAYCHRELGALLVWVWLSRPSRRV